MTALLLGKTKVLAPKPAASVIDLGDFSARPHFYLLEINMHFSLSYHQMKAVLYDVICNMPYIQ